MMASNVDVLNFYVPFHLSFSPWCFISFFSPFFSALTERNISEDCEHYCMKKKKKKIQEMLCSKNVRHQKHEYVFLLSFTVKPPWALTTDLCKVICADKGNSVWFCCFVPWASLVNHDQESRHMSWVFSPFFFYLFT